MKWSVKNRLVKALAPVLLFFGVHGTALANEFLPPEEAFQFTTTVHDPACVSNCLVDVRAVVEPEYYLYRERFALQNNQGLKSLEFVDLPRGEKKFDQFLEQEIESLRGEMVFQVRYDKDEQAPEGGGFILVSQGCADAGLCYPPMQTPVSLSASSFTGGLLEGSGFGGFFSGKKQAGSITSGAEPGGAGMFGGAVGGADNASSTGVGKSADEAGDLASRLAAQSAWVVLPVFFGLGLLLAFTPCTLPMLPILSSLVVGQNVPNGAKPKKPIALALVYVLGMATTYAVLGVLAGLSGQSLVMAMQQPIVLWGFGLVLALLGVVLLMGYSLQLPASFQGWIQEKTGRLQGGAYAPVAIMGILSALLLGPCIAPPLAGALLYIGQTGNALIGGAALFLLALGMGLPLVLFVAGAGAFLPKAGPWMNWVSATFGFLLIAVAVWTITPVTPTWLIMLAWSVLGCIVAAALFHGAATSSTMGTRAKVLSKGVGLMASLLALVYLMGLFAGGGTLLSPLAGLKTGSSGASVQRSAHDLFEPVSSAQALALLRESPTPVMLDFYADWCISCKEFEVFTLSKASVQQRLAGIRMVQVDVTDNTSDDQALMKHFNLFGPPAILFFPPGQDESVHRVIGFQNEATFGETLNQVRPQLGL